MSAKRTRRFSCTMFTIALLIFIFLIIIYAVFSLAILYHLLKYRSPGDLNLKSAVIFIAGSLVFISLAFLFFFSCPWQLIQI